MSDRGRGRGAGRGANDQPPHGMGRGAPPGRGRPLARGPMVRGLPPAQPQQQYQDPDASLQPEQQRPRPPSSSTPQTFGRSEPPGMAPEPQSSGAQPGFQQSNSSRGRGRDRPPGYGRGGPPPGVGRDDLPPGPREWTGSRGGRGRPDSSQFQDHQQAPQARQAHPQAHAQQSYSQMEQQQQQQQGRRPQAYQGQGAHPQGHGAHPQGQGAHPQGQGTHPQGHGAHPQGQGAYSQGQGAYPQGQGAQGAQGAQAQGPPARTRPPPQQQQQPQYQHPPQQQQQQQRQQSYQQPMQQPRQQPQFLLEAENDEDEGDEGEEERPPEPPVQPLQPVSRPTTSTTTTTATSSTTRMTTTTTTTTTSTSTSTSTGRPSQLAPGPGPGPGPGAAKPPPGAPMSQMEALSMRDQEKWEMQSTTSTDMSESSLSQSELCAHKAPGRTGQAVRLLSNFFPINFKPRAVYRYLVEFDPEIEPDRILERRMCLNSFSKELDKAYGFWVFDGTGMLSLENVKQDNEYSNDRALVHISHTKVIDTKDVTNQEVQMVVNVLLKKLLRKLKLIQFARSYYYQVPKPMPGTDLTMYTGFTFSVNPSVDGLQLLVDLSNRVMRQRTVREVMDDIEAGVRHSSRGLSEEQVLSKVRQRIDFELRGSVVMATYNHRIWRIDAVDYSKTMSSTFDRKGTPTSFRDYYAEMYKKVINTNKPGLLVNLKKAKKKRKNSPNEPPKETILIPELCHLTGVTDEMRSNMQLMRSLANETRLGPSERVAKIEKLMSDILNKKDVKEEVDKMPISLNSKPSTVNARVMGPFDVRFGEGSFRVGDNKSFSGPLRDAGFITKDGRPPTIDNWCAVYDVSTDREAKMFFQTVVKVSGQQGARLAQPHTFAAQGRGVEAWRKPMQEALAKNPTFILVAIPRGDPSIYSFVKHVCTVQNGVISQCFDTSRLRDPKMLAPICGNTFKQFMSKLGYQPWAIDHQKAQSKTSTYVMSGPKTMVVGIDVCHDARLKTAFGQNTASGSTVGFCASYDPTHTQYNSWMTYQNKGEEYVRTAGQLMELACVMYKKKNNYYPSNVIVFRDGVGNSQLESFVRREVAQFEAAFSRLGGKPKLTVIVVQKRIQVRFFEQCVCHQSRGQQRCTNNRKCNGENPYHSPQPGLVVDTQVVSSLFTDFYLVPSVAPPSATSRPTRFIVVRDDMQFSMDDIQILTNQMCYMYYNWPGPIRVPAACMYAHKIAYLFGKHVNGAPHQAVLDKLFYL